MGSGGTTTTQGIIPPELQGLYKGSADRLLGQQKENPLGQYNESAPLDVAGQGAMEKYGNSIVSGEGAQSPLYGLGLQSILRGPGLAGAGPTSGQYDYGSEAGLGTLNEFLSPARGYGEGMQNVRTPGPGPNAPPGRNAPAPDYGGLGDILGPSGGGQQGGAPPFGGGGLPTGNGGSQPAPPGGGILPPGVGGGPSSPMPPAPGSGAPPAKTSGFTMADLLSSGRSGAKLYDDWKLDANGMPIGAQGQKYTGAQHEYSGGLSPGSPHPQNPYGGNTSNQYGSGHDYKDWTGALELANAAKNAGVGPGASADQIVAGIAAKNAATAPIQQAEVARQQAMAADPSKIGQGGYKFTPNGGHSLSASPAPQAPAPAPLKQNNMPGAPGYTVTPSQPPKTTQAPQTKTKPPDDKKKKTTTVTR